MTLKEKLQEAKDKAKKLISENPEITSIWFEYTNIPLSEIKERAKELRTECDIVEKDGKKVLRLNSQMYDCENTVVFAYSVPVKIIQPKIVQESIIEAE